MTQLTALINLVGYIQEVRMRKMKLTVRDSKVDTKKVALLERWYAKKGIKLVVNYIVQEPKEK